MEVWTEKYRPRTLKDVVGQENIVKRLVAFTKNEGMPTYYSQALQEQGRQLALWH